MKKSLLALSLLATFATVASANVEVYGVVDVGFGFQNQKVSYNDNETSESDVIDLALEKGKFFTPEGKTNSFKMTKGWYSGPRFGLKGSEKVSDALTVGFKLEGGFSPLDGSLNDGLLFQREATLNAATPYGTVYVGRMGVLRGGAGSVGFFNGQANPFGGSWADVIGGVGPYTAQYSSRLNNTIAYVSPEFSGVKLYAQYSGGQKGSQNKSTDDRYVGLGALVSYGKLNVATVVDTTFLGSSSVYDPVTLTVANKTESLSAEKKNPFSFNLAANYDFDTFKLFGSAQFFKNAKNITNSLTNKLEFKEPPADYQVKKEDAIKYLEEMLDLNSQDLEAFKKDFTGISPNKFGDLIAKANALVYYNGFGLTTGASAPLGNGTVYASLGFMKAKSFVALNHNKADFLKVTRYGFGLGYDYKLSARTTLYAGLGGFQDKWKTADNESSAKQRFFQAGFGLAHKF